jgi:putative FmdB family regulatory protein
MPIYSYVCDKCGKEFEEFMHLSQKDKKVKCPKCKGKTHKIPSTVGRPVIN